ncbi:MAG: cellulase family glycosylhydrolase [Clostridia bacterium]|nr:cellulase family glycosylhydrolase [Clostridia bacterium]
MFKQTVFPRWRGFNLLGMFCSETSPINRGRAPGYFNEEDFKMIADFGFDFVRLPLSYRVWSSVENPYILEEEKLSPLDDAVHWGNKYGLHVNVCMHRIPGYCINTDEAETMNIWKDKEAQDAAVFQWESIAKRYTDISSEKLSFNVLNEAGYEATLYEYSIISKKVIDAVRKTTPDRLFIIDGINAGNMPPVDQMPVFENCGYSCRGYAPKGLTHYGAAGHSGYDGMTPVWPGGAQFELGELKFYDESNLDKLFGMWAALAQNFNVGVHCGEMGCYCNTPHDVVLSWFECVMNILKSYNIGYALWNFEGAFGIANSNRADVEYKKIGNKLIDEKLLKLLQKY